MSPTLKFKLTLAYDGGAYDGWQSQPSGRGVQDQVEAALVRLFTDPSRLESASRTDAGVHALGMTAHVVVPRGSFRMPVRHLPLAINALLPDDIRVLAAARVPDTFHARFDATGKRYRYEIWNHPAMNPLIRGTAWHVPRPLDIQAMRAAASLIPGTRDFSAFTSSCPGELKDPVRTVHRCDVQRRGPRVSVVIEGDGFLYKMCRGIAGTLVHIGERKSPPESISRILDTCDRRLAGPNAPAHGLVLCKVFYPARRRGA